MSTDRDQLAAALVFECELTASAAEARAAVDKLWPVVDRIAERRATERAAAELRAAAEKADSWGRPSANELRARADALDPS